MAHVGCPAYFQSCLPPPVLYALRSCVPSVLHPFFLSLLFLQLKWLPIFFSLPLYPENFIYSITRVNYPAAHLVIVWDVGFEPGTAASAVWHATHEQQHFSTNVHNVRSQQIFLQRSHHISIFTITLNDKKTTIHLVCVNNYNDYTSELGMPTTEYVCGRTHYFNMNLYAFFMGKHSKDDQKCRICILSHSWQNSKLIHRLFTPLLLSSQLSVRRRPERVCVRSLWCELQIDYFWRLYCTEMLSFYIIFRVN